MRATILEKERKKWGGGGGRHHSPQRLQFTPVTKLQTSVCSLAGESAQSDRRTEAGARGIVSLGKIWFLLAAYIVPMKEGGSKVGVNP